MKMYNKFLERLLDNNPEKVLSKGSINLRKVINPIFRIIVPLVTPNSRLKVVRRAKIPKQPVIFAATHGFREDIEHTVVMAGRPAYIVLGNLDVVFRTIAGIALWLFGIILLDRSDKNSREAAKKKMIYALKRGISIIIYPEGTWNKTPNKLVSGLFPGVYDVAKETGALVVPVATYRNGKKSYGILDEAFDITIYDRDEAIRVLRDKMATMQYEMIEKQGICKRARLPKGKVCDEYWKKYMNELFAEVKFSDYEKEVGFEYRPKGETNPEEAFSFIDRLVPNRNNMFLLCNRK